MQALQISTDLAVASQFIEALTGKRDTPVTFQTFIETKAKSKGGSFAKITHGSIAEEGGGLSKWNDLGAGIFVVVNETDLKGRAKENVVRVRALFMDFDDANAAPLQKIQQMAIKPHIVTESSEGKYHAYWRVADCQLSDFSKLQKALAAEYGSDPVVTDLPRLMRLPGFYHRKGKKFLSRIVEILDTPTYSVAQVKAALLPTAVAMPAAKTKPADAPKKSLNRLEVLNGVPEGRRDEQIFKVACSYRARNWDKEETKQLILEMAANCQPPFPAEEALEKLDQAWGYPAPTGAERLTELGNGKRFAEQYSDRVRWVGEFQAWLIWDGQRWCPDKSEEIMRLAKDTAMGLYKAVGGVSDSKDADAIAKHAAKSQSLRMLKAMIELARSEKGIPISQEQLDADPMLLGLRNGMLELRSGVVREASRDDSITKQANVTFDAMAVCPMWDAFLLRIAGGDRALVDFMQRAVGYTLTGLDKEQCLFFLFGTGRNGKSTFLRILSDLLGDYAAQCSTDTLMMKTRDGGATNDIARLRGARLVCAVEAEEGKRLAESLVKQLTGGDTITARFLFKEFIEFKPQFKIFLAANHKPIIRNDDFAIWRRIHLVPFLVTIPDNDIDKDLHIKLTGELPGILNWAIAGCLQWQKEGLNPPAAVTDATEAYRGEMNVFGAWLEDCCNVGKGFDSFARELYASYKQWSEDSGSYPLGSVKFALKLQERGFAKVRVTRGVLYHGICVR